MSQRCCPGSTSVTTMLIVLGPASIAVTAVFQEVPRGELGTDLWAGGRCPPGTDLPPGRADWRWRSKPADRLSRLRSTDGRPCRPVPDVRGTCREGRDHG